MLDMNYVHRVFGSTRLFLLSVPPENCSPHRNRENHYVNWLLSKTAIYPTASDKQGGINVFGWLKEYVLLLFSFLKSGNLLGFLMRLRYS